MRRDGVNPGPSHYDIRPIGLVERQGDAGARLLVFAPYRACLLGLDGFGHARVLWWFSACGDEAVGFYAVTGEGSAREIEHLWVAPDWMGRGVGRRMLGHRLARAPAAGVEELRVVSDPNAAGFYLRRGARQVGEQASVPAGRRLPVLVIPLPEGTAA